MKVCTKCGGDPKPLSSFGVDRSRPDGHTSRCKDCLAAYSRSWRAAKPKWRSGLPNEVRQQRNRKNHLALYGLSLDDYAKLEAVHKGLCGSCGMPPRGRGTGDRLQIDHCHKNGHVRGLLCGHCNKALGLLGDDPERIDALASYIRRSQAAAPS